MSLGLAGHDLFGRFAQQLANGNLSLVPFSRSFLPPPALLFPLPQPLPQVEGAHTPPLAGESERASDPVGVLPQFCPSSDRCET